jgi:hypothetical protein
MPDRTLIVSATKLRPWLASSCRLTGGARGEPVNALFAVARAIHRVLAFKTPSRAVAVIDETPGAAWPDLLRAQLAPLPHLLETLGIRVVRAPGEVHVAASYARAALDAGDDVIVVGVDKRFAQLVTDRLWWYDANKDARYTPEMVQKRFLVPPAQVAEWLALVGDDDALPGIAGLGAKGATDHRDPAPSRPRSPPPTDHRPAGQRCAPRATTSARAARARLDEPAAADPARRARLCAARGRCAQRALRPPRVRQLPCHSGPTVARSGRGVRDRRAARLRPRAPRGRGDGPVALRAARGSGAGAP